ncbi:MAG: LysR substrate-binding domain-containing protein [Micromonosporaceae bacterium]
MNLELRHLRVVCAIAESGSLTKAAASLGLAQPALTAQLHRIEHALGGVLFERGRQGSRPTALGELVLARAKVLLPAARELQEEAVRLAHAGPARYRIGAVNGPLLGGLVHRLSAEQPDAPITIHPAWSAAELISRVAEATLDYAIVGVCGNAEPEGGADLVWRVLAVDPVFVLLPEKHPLAGEPEVELALLADARWGATPGDGCFGDCFVKACAAAGFSPRPLYEADVAGCTDLVLAGEAVALCQPTFRLTPGLVTVPLAGTPLRWRHLIGWHPQAPAAVLGDRIAQHAVAAYQEAVDRSPRYTRWLREHPGFGAVGHNAAV